MVLLTASEARNTALNAQGIRGTSGPEPATLQTVAATIRRMGLLQLDFVNILTPSHYLVLWSRLGHYDRGLLDRLVYSNNGERQFTEQWAHEASIVPFELWPLLAHRREAHRVRPYSFEQYLEPRYMKRLLAEVKRKGPLRPDELPPPADIPASLADTWYRSMQRIALEAMFGRGELAIASREPDFARRYDLTERVIPKEHRETSHTTPEQVRKLLLIAARACGAATAADLADYFRMPASAAKPGIAKLVATGELEPVQVEGWKELAYRPTAGQTVDGKPPGDGQRLHLLSPFDPVVWFRKRTERLFGFEYRLEIFVPAEKRRWGCFCLPVLCGEHLIARVDLKAERKEGVLAVLATIPEDQHLKQPGSDAQFCELLPAKLHELARWLGLERAVSRHPQRNRVLRGTLASTRASRAAGRALP